MKFLLREEGLLREGGLIERGLNRTFAVFVKFDLRISSTSNCVKSAPKPSIKLICPLLIRSPNELSNMGSPF